MMCSCVRLMSGSECAFDWQGHRVVSCGDLAVYAHVSESAAPSHHPLSRLREC